LSVYENIKSELFNYDEEYELNSEQYESELKELELAGQIIDREIVTSRVGSIIKDYNRGKYIVKKNQRAVDITKELLSENKKVILWDVFVENMRILKQMISSQLNTSVEIINGSIVGEDRQAIIDNFRDGELKVLIASPATLSESISLHKCCQNAIYVNRNYNAAQFIQSKDRIHRINMPEGTTATYNFLINIETIDEAINERLELKEVRMLKILDAEDIVIGDLDCNETSTMSREDVEKSYLT
jgi:superfamily II DNA or RNA helicase